jgi:hypothetical protein
MKRCFVMLSVFFSLFVLCASFMTAAQLVNIGAAQRAAEYHAESIFEKDLKVCDHELLRWAWGEPAVYVFTLMREGDIYPSNILQDPTLLRGAYLVSIGKEGEGYEKMAQPDRYWSVYVGATSDMPSFLKAHAGLPEHIVTQPLMKNMPRDPYWIYGDLFHILVTSRSRMGLKDTKATEINLNKEYDLKDLGQDKVDTIPEYAEQDEWGRFVDAREDLKPIVKGTTVELKVKESNLQGKWWGCAAAAFYNCLKYIEEKGKVRLPGKTASFIQEWISIYYVAEFDGKNYWTILKNEIPGSKMVFRGLNYNSTVIFTDRTKYPDNFFPRYAYEIKSGYPCSLSLGRGIFYKHATTGIGFWTSGNQVKLIIHDGWKKTTRPVWTKYSGYPDKDLQFPDALLTFRPGISKKYPTAKPVFVGPDILYSSKTDSSWEWDEELKSSNNVKAWVYTYDINFRNSAGAIYEHLEPKYDRMIPYASAWTWYLPKTIYKPGTMEAKYKVLDENGHLLTAQKTVSLCIGDGYTGPFIGEEKRVDIDLRMAVDTTVNIAVSGSGSASDPYSGHFWIEGSMVLTGGGVPIKYTIGGKDGTATVSGSNYQIEVAPTTVYFTQIEDQTVKPPLVVSFKGQIVGNAIAGTITLALTENVLKIIKVLTLAKLR